MGRLYEEMLQHYVSLDSLHSTAREAGKEPSLNTWVAMATVTLRALLEELKEGGGNGGRHIRK